MDLIYDAARQNPLFNGVGQREFDKILDCVEARRQRYEKDELLMLSGDPVRFVGLLLSGSVRIIKEGMDGSVTILAELTVSDLFGEVFACAGVDHSPVTVQACEACEILWINYKKIITTCSSACDFHTRLIENMLRVIAMKNIMLNQKIELLSKRTTREKLLLFFDMQRGKAKRFTIPFNREEMAQYLCVDRSAMSAELGRMRDEGLIQFNRNQFEIL